MDPTRASGNEFLLSESYLKAVIPGETAGVSQADAKQELLKSIDNTDVRLNQLLDDFIFLYAHDDFPTGRSLYDSLVPGDPTREAMDWEIWFTPTHPDTDTLELGALLAQLPRVVLETTDDYQRPFIEDVLWGFLIGLVSRSPEDTEMEISQIRDILDEFNRYIVYREMEGTRRTETEGIKNKAMVKAIDNLGYEPTSTLYRFIHKQILQSRYKYDRPDESTDVAGFEQVSAKVIEDLNNKTDFESAVKLRRKLDEDRELVTDLRFEKIRPIEILRIIQSKGPLSQPRIANETSYRLGAVRKHLNDLSGQGKHTTGPNWTDPPIVNQTNSGWELTQYGKLLLEYLENPESTAEKLHKFSIPDQSLEDMLAVDELPDDQKRRIGNILSEINFEPD